MTDKKTSNTRKFGKETYSIWTFSNHKDTSKKAAISKRKAGYKARVIKAKNKWNDNIYIVYTRSKKK